MTRNESLTSRLARAAATLRDQVATRRDQQRAERTLRAELAVFDTPAEIDDLYAAAHETDGDDARVVEAILRENLAAYHMNRRTTAVA